MKYKVGDVIQLKHGHSEGDFAKIHEVDEDRMMYKIYIPYWDFFYISDDEIIGLHNGL
jgi:hypothetical protein